VKSGLIYCGVRRADFVVFDFVLVKGYGSLILVLGLVFSFPLNHLLSAAVLVLRFNLHSCSFQFSEHFKKLMYMIAQVVHSSLSRLHSFQQFSPSLYCRTTLCMLVTHGRSSGRVRKLAHACGR
jgi:hypothetical protein